MAGAPRIRTRELITHPWLTVCVQIALGAIFVVAALPKIADPPSFAHLVYNYRLLPGSLINLTALVMPWIELIAGLALIAGVWAAAARGVIAGLLVLFMTAIAINLARGNAIDCGCFDVSAVDKSYEERIADMWWVLARDAGMLLMVAQLWAADRAGHRRERARTALDRMPHAFGGRLLH
ncbi:MAG TPA: MauE/DoxX family redox-associated membrane protein [Thermoanaerobaculia bacterium]|nr:MauE/DoxX family redox-associated membrane protein [Thermoanaerobaculia bacterium]